MVYYDNEKPLPADWKDDGLYDDVISESIADPLVAAVVGFSSGTVHVKGPSQEELMHRMESAVVALHSPSGIESLVNAQLGKKRPGLLGLLRLRRRAGSKTDTAYCI